MRIRRRLSIALACAHLAVTAAFLWTDTARWVPGKVWPVVRLYQNLSGLFRDYTFFAPYVASDVKAGFLLEDQAGRTAVVSFTADRNEPAFRYNAIISASLRDEPARDLYARSWAAVLLGARPDVRKVTVFAKVLLLPTMAEYRQGRRPEWRLIYVSQFARAANVPAEERSAVRR